MWRDWKSVLNFLHDNNRNIFRNYLINYFILFIIAEHDGDNVIKEDAPCAKKKITVIPY